MTPNPETVVETTTLGDAQRLMSDRKIRHLPVLRQGRLCGIISARDILRYRATTPFREDWWRAPVVSAMVEHPQTANPDDSVVEATARLASARIGALPIVRLGKLIGIVTVTDLLQAEVQRAMQ